MRILKRHNIFLVLLIAVAVILTGCSGSKRYKVLLIQSYDKEYAKASLLEKGVKDYFKKEGVKADLDVAYMDCEIKTSDEEVNFLRKLVDSYSGKQLDLIIVCDDQATFSLLETQHPETYRIPIVFCGVDYFNPELMKGHSNVTGFILHHDFTQTVNLAKKLFNTNKIYYLTDSTFLGRRFKSDFEYQMKQANDSIEIEYLNASVRRSKFLIWKFNTAEPNSMIIIPRYDNIYPLYSLKTSVPVFVMSNEAFNGNVFSGYIVDDEQQTAEAAQTGLEILNGRDPKDIPVRQHHQQMTFNWNRLKKWNVDENSLPAGSIIVNIPFFEKYFWYIMAGSCLLILLVYYLVSQYIMERRQKRQAQLNLIKQRNEFDITLRALCECVISVGCDGKIFGINKKAKEFLSMCSSEKKYIGKDIHSLLTLTNTKDNTFCLAALMKQAIETGEPVFFPEKTFLADGCHSFTFPISGEVVRIYKDHVVHGTVIVFRDISNEYTQQELLELTFNESKVYPWIFDVEQQAVSYGNKSTGEENLSTSLYEDFSRKMHPDDIPTWKAVCQDALQGKMKRGSFQARMKTDENNYEWWEYRFSCMPETPLKPPLKIIGICMNIEDVKKKEAELVLARDMAAKAELKQSFLANMSHEIRTPLNAIVGFSNLLVEQDDLEEEERKEFTQAINKNCEVLLNLVSDVLEISRIDSGNMSFKNETCEITTLLGDLYSSFSILVPDTIGFELIVPSSPLTLVTDPMRLTQVLTNFFNNALKFTKKGKIILGCALDENGFIDLYVEDTGKGIPSEEQMVIFDRFYKSDEFAQGTGLGLAICKMIAERLNGNILLKSKVGTGSRFTIRLPHNR